MSADLSGTTYDAILPTCPDVSVSFGVEQRLSYSQVRSSASTGTTSDWFRQTTAAAGQAAVQSSSSSNISSKLPSIRDPMIGQVSIRLSALHMALLPAGKQRHNELPWMQQQQLVLPLYGPLTGHSDGQFQEGQQPGSPKGSTRAASKRSFGLRSKKYAAGVISTPGQQLPDFLADAAQLEQQIAAGVAGVAMAAVGQHKAPLAVPHTASAASKGLQHLVLYDPISGTSYGVQGRELVGRVHLLLTYNVVEQLQPASNTAQLTSVPVQLLLHAAEARGQQISLPKPLCPNISTIGGQSQPHEAATSSPRADGPGHAGMAAAQELVSVVWHLWKVGGVSDLAASYDAECSAALQSGVQQVSSSIRGSNSQKPLSYFAAASAAAAAAIAEGINSPKLPAARGRVPGLPQGLTPAGSAADWTLGSSHSYADSVTHSEAYGDRFSYLQCEYELSHGSGGLMLNHSGQGSGASSPHSPGGSSWCIASAAYGSGSDKIGNAFRIEDWRQPLSAAAPDSNQGGMLSTLTHEPPAQQQLQQGSRLQRLTRNTESDDMHSSSCAAQQQQSAMQKAPSQPEAGVALKQGTSPATREAAALVMQFLSLQQLTLPASVDAAAVEEQVLPGAFYLHLMHDAALLTGARYKTLMQIASAACTVHCLQDGHCGVVTYADITSMPFAACFAMLSTGLLQCDWVCLANCCCPGCQVRGTFRQSWTCSAH